MEPWKSRLAALAGRSNCRLTTRGRRTGKPHAVTVWFGVEGSTVYLATLRMDRDWPKNVAANPDVVLEIGDLRLRGEARLVPEGPDRDRIASLLRVKYLVSRIASWFGVAPQGIFRVVVRGEAD